MKKAKKEGACLCGSGKPCYQCCGQKPKVVSLVQFKLRKAGRLLRQKLADFADQPHFAQEAVRAQQIYIQDIDTDLLAYNDEFIAERCFEWFIFDCRLSTGHTVIELFSKSPDLSGEEKELLEQWIKARLTLYEIKEILPGKGAVLQDLISPAGVTLTVDDATVAKKLKTGMVILIRVLKAGDNYEFSTNGLVLPAIHKDILVTRVHSDIEAFCRQKNIIPGEGINLYLKEKACILNALILKTGKEYLYPLPPEKTANDLIQKESEEKDRTNYHNFYRACRGPGVGSKAKEVNPISLKAIRESKWPNPRCARVAHQVGEDLKVLGYNTQQITAALRMWQDFYILAKPSFRKIGGWVASVIYTIARLDYDKRISQQELAKKYGIAVSTISTNFQSLCRTLKLEVFDRRYSTRSKVFSHISGIHLPLSRLRKD